MLILNTVETIIKEVEMVTLVMGPVGVPVDRWPSEPAETPLWVEPWLDPAGLFVRNAAMAVDTPSERSNCSLSSMFVRPLARSTKCGEGSVALSMQKI